MSGTSYHTFKSRAAAKPLLSGKLPLAHRPKGAAGSPGLSRRALTQKTRGLDKSRFFGAAAAAFFLAMALFPQSIYSGARRGLDLWAGILVPSMLPFFILAEILMGSGILQILGRLLQPLMRPLFNLPGAAGLGLALGYTSGFPMGAVITGRLYTEHYLSRDEAARLLAFTNNSSPGFLLTSLAAGMLTCPEAGGLLALCHYGSNLLFGLLLGLYSRFAKNHAMKTKAGSRQISLKTTAPAGAFSLSSHGKAAGSASETNSSASLSRLVTTAISSAIQSILSLGGYVLLFSAGIKLLEDLGLLSWIAALFQFCLPEGLEAVGLSRALAAGLFEMTLGLNLLTSLSLPLQQVFPYCLVLLGWSGFSVQAQVAGLAGSARLPLGYYLWGCFMQPLLSLVLFILCRCLLRF